MCAPSPPPPPDYVGAANAQGAANKDAAIVSGRYNNPNVFNPYGVQEWKEGATVDDRPTLTQTFSPAQQALYDQSIQTKKRLGELGTQGAEALQSLIGRQLDLSGAPEMGSTNFAAGAPSRGNTDFTAGAPARPGDYEGTRAKVINAMMGRVNEDYGRQTDQTNSDLVAAGIRPGSKAYDDKMALLDRGRNDARGQAEIAGGNAAAQAYGMDAARRASAFGENQAMSGAQNAARSAAFGENQIMSGAQNEQRRSAIAEMLAKRQTPLNEVTALMSGSQVSNPFAVPGASGGMNIAPPPLYNAAMQKSGYETDMFNANQGNNNAMLSGLFSLGSAFLSDRRLKRDIVKVADDPRGFGWYRFRYLWSDALHVGVMAQELLGVMPEAVVTLPSGYMAVNYEAL